MTKLANVLDTPKPSPDAVAAAKAAGATLVPYSPGRLRAFLEGRITLAALEGIDKDAQYELARVGYRFIEEGRLDRAETVFKGLLSLDPYDAYFLTVLGGLAQRRNALEEAERWYDRALEVNPFSVDALANRGEIRLAKEEVSGALTDLMRAIDEDPEAEGSKRARLLLDAVAKQAREIGGGGGKVRRRTRGV